MTCRIGCAPRPCLCRAWSGSTGPGVADLAPYAKIDDHPLAPPPIRLEILFERDRAPVDPASPSRYASSALANTLLYAFSLARSQYSGAPHHATRPAGGRVKRTGLPPTTRTRRRRRARDRVTAQLPGASPLGRCGCELQPCGLLDNQQVKYGVCQRAVAEEALQVNHQVAPRARDLLQHAASLRLQPRRAPMHDHDFPPASEPAEPGESNLVDSGDIPGNRNRPSRRTPGEVWTRQVERVGDLIVDHGPKAPPGPARLDHQDIERRVNDGGVSARDGVASEKEIYLGR